MRRRDVEMLVREVWRRPVVGEKQAGGAGPAPVPRLATVRAEARKANPLKALRGLQRERLHVEKEVGRAVAEARRQGRTWAEISGALGVTQSAASQRYGKRGVSS
jgi:hypothetical protein